MTITTDLTTPGTRVLIDHPRETGRTFVVVEKLVKNVRVRDEGGGSRTLVVHPMLLRPAPAAAGEPIANVLGQPYVPPVIFVAGQTVKLRNKPGVFVVLKPTQRGYSVAPLGGDNGRYWNAHASLLTACTIRFEEES